MRRTLLTGIALTLALAGCTGTIHCKPCGSAGRIDLRPISAGVTAVRVCYDGQCGTLEPMSTPPKESVGLGSEIYDASDITLELYSGKKFLKSYSGPIDAERGDPDDCSCDSYKMAPTDSGTLIQLP